MVYLAFDLDGTLGEFLILSEFLCIFRQKGTTSNQTKNINLDLGISYTSLIKRIGDAETSKTPLGIFRPGIFDLFKEICALKKTGKINGVIIYSNNASKPLVEFVTDVFNYVLHDIVFDGIFYRYHPLRLNIVHQIYNPQKTWKEIHILLKSIGAPDDLHTKDVIFFDDQNHQDLKTTLGNNYIQVNPYKYNPPLATVMDIYNNTLKNSNIISDERKMEFFEHIKGCTNNIKTNNIEQHLNLVKKMVPGGVKRSGRGVIPSDKHLGTKYMIDNIKKRFNIKTNGGKRTRKTEHKKLSNRITLWKKY
jgi:hypothetical protein